MIHFKDVTKQFHTKDQNIHALNGVSLTINPNTIHGIIGLSGAGKSTLIRTINQLERHDTGEIKVLGYNDIRALNKESTRMLRQQVGMIFQTFNLLESKTVLENILFPIRVMRKPAQEDHALALSLIEEVGLKGYEQSFPSQLSGGQKQRVGIARALINQPKILLCDEPTSALDPLTTKSILALIKTLKEKQHLTVVIVTHDMHVIKEICDDVTVMDHGRVIESGPISDLLITPKHTITKALVDTIGFDVDALAESYKHLPSLTTLRFPKDILENHLIYTVIDRFDVKINILYANITPNTEGVMLVSFEGDQTFEAKAYLQEKGVKFLHD